MQSGEVLQDKWKVRSVQVLPRYDGYILLCTVDFCSPRSPFHLSCRSISSVSFVFHSRSDLTKVAAYISNRRAIVHSSFVFICPFPSSQQFRSCLIWPSYAAPFSCSQTVLSNEIPFRRPSLHLVYFVLSLLSFSVQSTAAKLRILFLFSRS